MGGLKSPGDYATFKFPPPSRHDLILLSTAFADLTNSSNAMTLGDLSGANRSTRYETGNDDDDRPVTGFCDEREGFVWDADAKACVQRIDALAELLLETQ